MDPQLTQKAMYLELILATASSMLGKGKDSSAIGSAIEKIIQRKEFDSFREDIHIDPTLIAAGPKTFYIQATIYGQDTILWVFDPKATAPAFLKQNHVDPEYIARGFWAQRMTKALVLTDVTPREPAGVKDFTQQVDCIQAIAAYKGTPPIQLIRYFFERSGLFSKGALNALKDLEEIEIAGDKSTALQQEKVLSARVALKQLTSYLPENLREARTWNAIDPTKYQLGRSEYNLEGRIADALDKLGWRFAMLEGKARVVLKGAVLTDEAFPLKTIASKKSTRVVGQKASAQTPSAQTALMTVDTKLASASSTTPSIDPAMQIIQRQALAQQVRALFDANSYKEAAQLLVLGIKEPAQAREVITILQDELGPANSAVLLSRVPPETAAYLIASAVAAGEKSRLLRDVLKPFTAKAQMDEKGLVWACDVLVMVNQFSPKGAANADSIANGIFRMMAVREEIPFGAEVAELVVVRCLNQAKTSPEQYGLGIAAYEALDTYFDQRIKILNPLQDATKSWKLFARDIPKEKRIAGDIPLTTDQELVEHVTALLERGIRFPAEVSDEKALRLAAQILFVKLEPLRAFRVIDEIAKKRIHLLVQGVDVHYVKGEELSYLLPFVSPRFIARFFIAIHEGTKASEKQNILQWTMERLARLVELESAGRPNSILAAKEIVKALLFDEFVSQGGRELFRKILNPKAAYSADLLDLYEALYQETPDMVDWFTLMKTGKLYTHELTEKEKSRSVKEWTKEILPLLDQWYGVDRALQHLEKISRLDAGGTIINDLIFLVFKCLEKKPIEWGLTQEDYDRFNIACLKTAYQINGLAFTPFFWEIYAEHVLDDRSPIFGHKVMVDQHKIVRTVLKALDAKQQVELMLDNYFMYTSITTKSSSSFSTRFIRDDFLRVALSHYPGDLYPMTVAAGAFNNNFMEDELRYDDEYLAASEAMVRTRRLVHLHHPYLAGLYHYQQITDDRLKKPFGGEYVNMEIALGTTAYETFLDTFEDITGHDVSQYKRKLQSHEPISTFPGLSSVDHDVKIFLREHPKEWLAIHSIPDPKFRAAELKRFFVPLEIDKEARDFFPLLSDYMAYATSPEEAHTEALDSILRHVWTALQEVTGKKLEESARGRLTDALVEAEVIRSQIAQLQQPASQEVLLLESGMAGGGIGALTLTNPVNETMGTSLASMTAGVHNRWVKVPKLRRELGKREVDIGEEFFNNLMDAREPLENQIPGLLWEEASPEAKERIRAVDAADVSEMERLLKEIGYVEQKFSIDWIIYEYASQHLGILQAEQVTPSMPTEKQQFAPIPPWVPEIMKAQNQDFLDRLHKSDLSGYLVHPVSYLTSSAVSTSSVVESAL